MRQNSIIKVDDGKSSFLAIVTKVLNKDYVSVIKSDGTVIPNVYVGYIEPLGEEIDIGSVLRSLKNL